MKLYLKNRLRALILKRSIIQLSSVLILLLLLLVFFIFTKSNITITYIIIFIVSVSLIITATSFKRNFSLKLTEADVEILKIIIAFLKHKNTDIEQNRSFIKEKFKPFRERQFFQYLDFYKEESFDVENSVISISESEQILKVFLMELLLDISLAEGILKTEDEDFIDNTVLLIKLDLNIYLSIKKTYIQKGLKTERNIYNIGKEKVVSGSFKLLNACQLLNVSPNVRHEELKKAYRNLAKQYHPDKFHGQSSENNKFAEDKFQEIKSAYEIIINHKGF